MAKVFIVLPQSTGKFGVYTDNEGHYHPVKSGLSEEKAEMMCEILNNIVDDDNSYEEDDNDWCGTGGC